MFKITDHARHMSWIAIHAVIFEQGRLAEEAGQSRLRVQPHIDWHWLQLWLKVCLTQANPEDMESSPRETL